MLMISLRFCLPAQLLLLVVLLLLLLLTRLLLQRQALLLLLPKQWRIWVLLQLLCCQHMLSFVHCCSTITSYTSSSCISCSCCCTLLPFLPRSSGRESRVLPLHACLQLRFASA
jgi:hypothetical protein